MQPNFSILTNDELKTRALWRRCFLISHWSIGLLVLMGAIFSFFEEAPEKLNKLYTTFETLGALGLFYLLIYISYHFIYKKCGTFLLALSLCFMSINILSYTFLLVFTPGVYIKCFMAAIILIWLFFYRLNWKLRKINKKLRLNGIYPEEYVLETKSFANVTSKDELDLLYTALMQKWPQFEKHSSHIYKQHLSSLKANNLPKLL